jgi:hypothetical protein
LVFLEWLVKVAALDDLDLEAREARMENHEEPLKIVTQPAKIGCMYQREIV